MNRFLAFTLAAAAVAVSACSTPPRGQTDPGEAPADSPPAEQSDEDERYSFEEEGEFPEAPDDVAFEEDELPPAPEDVAGEPLSASPIESERIDETTNLPDPEGRIEPEVSTPVAPAVTTPVPRGSDVEVVRGFRVQLLAVNEVARAESLAREAEQRLGVRVHVVSEGPHFKVRAGDFTDRAEAVRLKERASSLGYDGCWVVTDQVELRR
jgi:hypothetical protein